MYANMKIQDFFPFDSAVIGLRNLYSEAGDDSFFTNTSCVIAKDKILTKGKHYLIFDVATKNGLTITEIVLIDLFFYEAYIHLISEDINTQRLSIISFCLECPKTNCMKFLVDKDYFIDRMDANAVQDYCGCENNKQKPIRESKTKITDDLLEFDL